MDVLQIKAIMTQSSDRWVKCISTHGNIRGVAMLARNLVQIQATQHELKGDAICRLGESLMAGLLVSSYCKRGEKININIQGSGKYKQALVDAYPDATVRGYLIERESPEELEENQGPWGSGTLSVLRTKDQEGQTPYIGTVPLLTGHLAKDLSFYWVQSEQIPTAVGLAVQAHDQQVRAAGAFLIQAMPGASPEEVRAIEEHILELESFTNKLLEIESPVQLLSHIFQNTAFMVVEERPLEFKCTCSWERVRRALSLIGSEELNAMLIDDKVSVVKCDFCSHEYVVEKPAIQELLDQIKGPNPA